MFEDICSYTGEGVTVIKKVEGADAAVHSTQYRTVSMVQH